MEHKNNCIICGADIIYLETQVEKTCYYCNFKSATNTICKSGHFICDSCHSAGALNLIEKFCISTDLMDPIEMVNILMKNPAVKMHGPEHHFLIPAVLITAYYNFLKQPELKENKILKARTRAKKIPGGNCGFLGNCGAAVGTGIFMSLITGATPLSKQEWRVSNLMTAESLHRIAVSGGPRCCKRNTYIAILEAVKFINEHMKIRLVAPDIINCEYSDLNSECIGKECLFYTES
ncbi:MAG: SAM-dependent methyltransferase [bacterium]|nr:SAM-dependent methyltransferase [bacterium]